MICAPDYRIFLEHREDLSEADLVATIEDPEIDIAKAYGGILACAVKTARDKVLGLAPSTDRPSREVFRSGSVGSEVRLC